MEGESLNTWKNGVARALKRFVEDGTMAKGQKCDNCNFQTLKVVKEEILSSPTTSEKGELMKYYECTYCNHKERKLFTIGRIKISEDVEKSVV